MIPLARAVVVDASVVAALALGEARAGEAVALLGGRTMVAPSLLRYEVANAARSLAMRHPELTASIKASLALCWTLPFSWVTPDPSDILTRALESGLTCYDAAYLDVALRAGLPLVTFDERLASAHEAVAKSPPTTT